MSADLRGLVSAVQPSCRPGLLFSQFAEMGEFLQRHVQEPFRCEIVFLHGGVPETQARPHDRTRPGRRQGAEKVVSIGEGWLTELSTSVLKELFALRTVAVAR